MHRRKEPILTRNINQGDPTLMWTQLRKISNFHRGAVVEVHLHNLEMLTCGIAILRPVFDVEYVRSLKGHNPRGSALSLSDPVVFSNIQQRWIIPGTMWLEGQTCQQFSFKHVVAAFDSEGVQLICTRQTKIVLAQDLLEQPKAYA